MNGKEYISSFIDKGYIEPDSEIAEQLEAGYVDTNANLWARITGLYDGEVHFLTDSLAPQVVMDARARLNEEHESAQILKAGASAVNYTMQKQGLYNPDKCIIDRLPPDFSASMTPEELTAKIENDQSILQAQLAGYSEGLLNLALFNIHKRSQGFNVGNKEIAQEIKIAINTKRGELREVLRPWQGVITIERDFALSRAGSLAALKDVRVMVDRKGQNIQEWVPATKEWHDPIHVLCSMASEVETLIALQEWVMDRQLPYLPVSAPFEFERGRLASRKDGNKRADILVCCLVPDRNEIVPVQVKNTVSQAVRSEYHPGIVLVSPRDLGLESSESCIVRNNGRAETGHRTIVKYGTITDHNFTVHKTSARKARPPKQAIAAYANTLKPAFEFFDASLNISANKT